MNVRNATVADARAISALINQYAEHDRMLFRSLADIYENLQTFTVVEAEGEVVGCCALDVVWADLAEIKSLAVDQKFMNRGVGCMLVGAATEQAQKLGLPRLFALTLTPAFFVKLGFEIIDTDKLPMKVWSDCARCPKQQNCDETAVVKTLPPQA
ncbi:MAG: N-acetyltransferase [Phycisphaerales bacterium]|nr:MAG: N-acetyltransferase [Phycisphaerales bacterium]